jgi:hypothetical protein
VLAWLSRHPRWTFHFTPTNVWMTSRNAARPESLEIQLRQLADDFEARKDEF